MTYDNIRIHKNHGFTLYLEDKFLEKTEKGGGGGSKLTPPPFLTLAV